MTSQEIIKIQEVLKFILLEYEVWLNDKSYIQFGKNGLYQFTETKKGNWEQKKLEGELSDFIKLFLAIDEKEITRLWFEERKDLVNDLYNTKLETQHE